MHQEELITIGWREWADLKELNIHSIKAKIDTGARTSSLHAFDIEPIEEDGVQRLRFKIQPEQRDSETIVSCTADISDRRDVRDSGGRLETRWVIVSQLTLGALSWPIDITLTSRQDMRFRMLLGRHAMKNRVMVNPSRSYLMGKRRRKKKKTS